MFLRRHKPILSSILFSLFVVGFAYWYAHREQTVPELSQVTEDTHQDVVGYDIRGLEATDHILGNPEAPILFIVYSDFSCPYCKSYHKALKTLMRLYGSSGEVALVFRHLPFVQLHPESPMYALASECVAQEKGNVGFWKFVDEIFEAADPLQPLTAAELVLLSEKVGVTRQSFVACMRSNELMEVVERDFQEAIDAGVQGSPFTIIDDPVGRTSYEGELSFRTMAEAVQTTLRSQNIEHLESPSAGSFMADFDSLDTSASTTATSTRPAATSTQKQSSILDGIISE